MKKKSKLKKLKKKMLETSRLLDLAAVTYLKASDAYAEEYFKKAKK